MSNKLMKKTGKNEKETKEVAIKVENLSKTFKVPHEKHSSLKQAAFKVFSHKSYEEFNALKDVNFEVKKGEFFGIIGRNGSGKSTLLKILAGIYIPDSKGQVTVNGKLSPFLELGVGFNFELTGRENIFLGGSILGLSKKEVEEKFDKIVVFAELEEFIDMKLKNYSSGMQVRLAFALSINAHADILLMDEVLAVGDTNFQSKCLEEFNQYRKQGKTVVLVTHDVSVVRRYCNRAMLLRNGKIMKIGKAEDVVNEYIEENMSDEEKRILEEQKKSGQKIIKSKGTKNKVAEIKKVEFLDSKGGVRNVFRTGDDLSIRVHFDIHEMKDEFNFGFALYNQYDEYILGVNSIFDKVDVQKYLENKYFQINLKNIILNTNSYYIKASIVKNNFNFFYDWLDGSQPFKVASTSHCEGIMGTGYEWDKLE